MDEKARSDKAGLDIRSANRGPSIEARVRDLQIDIMFRTAPTAMLAAVSAACLIVAGVKYLYGLSDQVALTWLAVQFSTFSTLEAISLLYWRSPRSPRDREKWALAFTSGIFVGGLAWGIGAIFLLAPSSMERELFVALILTALASGTVLAIGSYLPATFAHFLPLVLPMAFRSLTRGDGIHYFLGFLAIGYIGAISALAWMSNRNLTRSLRLEFENFDLIEDLRKERDAAEQANLAKSRFLASASHDLRQPVHALSMFVGALSEKPLAAESRDLVDQIANSVETMDGLFNSLLDISKLDAGVVRANIVSFEIGPLLSRVCREFEAGASAKGLSLTVSACRLVVQTDPVLLANILRNLVSNAVRYTKNGRILVGCRRGPRLRIEILDTGVGIANAHQEKIFEEFYQVGNPERDRSKGLGLGLAIVRRLARLCECEVAIESRLGKGTRASLWVPLARDRVRQESERPQSILPAASPGLIFVIDDEAPIRAAMSSLLASWGHQTIVAESGREIMELAARVRRRPDLIICDYRLREGENGAELMRRLQSEYNDDIPGILLTGDTAAERLIEAESSGFVVLHKPLSSAKLRAGVQALLLRALEQRELSAHCWPGLREIAPRGD